VPIEGQSRILLKGLIKELRSIQPDVIHLHGIWTWPTLQVFLSSFTGAKLFVDDHVDNANFKMEKLSRQLWILFFKRTILPIILRRAEKVISVNPMSKWHLENNLGIPSTEIAMLPLGVDEETRYPDSNLRENKRKELGLRDEEVLFFSVGWFDPTKDLEVLVSAFSEVAFKYKQARLMLVGDGETSYVNKLKDLVSTNGLEEKVIFPGWQPTSKLNEYYNAGDVAVMPNKISAAIASIGVGVPLIVTRNRACEYFVSNENGASFERGQHTELAKIMAGYLEDDELGERQGRQSLELVRNELSWAKIAQKSVEIYESGREL
jgi:glycosyltransferase involved in cell wall biosynthesis